MKIEIIVFLMTIHIPKCIGNTTTKCIEEVCVPADYNHLVRPLLNDTNLIHVDFRDLKILKVDDHESTIAISSSIWLSWIEPRIMVTSEVPDIFPIDKTFLKLLWLPDAYIYNLQSIKQHAFIHNFDGLLLVNQTWVTYNVELEVDIYCPMTFESYPIDTHACYFMLGSYSYDEDILNFNLRHLEFDPRDQVSLLDYSLKVNPLPRFKKYRYRGDMKYKRTGCEIVLERNIKKYIINYYVPSGLLVVVSWVSKKCLENLFTIEWY